MRLGSALESALGGGGGGGFVARLKALNLTGGDATNTYQTLVLKKYDNW